MRCQLGRLVLLGLLTCALAESSRAQDPFGSRSLAHAIIDTAAAYGRQLTAPSADVLVDDSSFAAHLPASDVAAAATRGRRGLRMRGSNPRFVCGSERHTCRLTTSGSAIQLDKLRQHGDSAVAEVVVSETVESPGNRSDVMYTMLRLQLQRIDGGWRCVAMETLFTT